MLADGFSNLLGRQHGGAVLFVQLVELLPQGDGNPPVAAGVGVGAVEGMAVGEGFVEVDVAPTIFLGDFFVGVPQLGEPGWRLSPKPALRMRSLSSSGTIVGGETRASLAVGAFLRKVCRFGHVCAVAATVSPCGGR